MSIEEQYYEIDGFWDESLFETSRERFRSLAGEIPEQVRSVLDVGSGNGGFVHYLAAQTGRFDTIHAVDRSEAALQRVRVPKTRASIDALPFEDRSFDLVTAFEVLEHLPFSIQQAGIAHLCRIARSHVMIAVPNEEKLEATMIQCGECHTVFNPDYHMHSFDAAKLHGLFAPQGFRPVRTWYTNPMRHYFLVTALTRRLSPVALRPNPFSIAFPCPMCGFTIPANTGGMAGGHANSALNETAVKDSALKGLIKRILHTKTTYGNLSVLFERV